jgi:hypothetical protein
VKKRSLAAVEIGHAARSRVTTAMTSDAIPRSGSLARVRTGNISLPVLGIAIAHTDLDPRTVLRDLVGRRLRAVDGPEVCFSCIALYPTEYIE